MGTIKDYFYTDSHHGIKVTQSNELTHADGKVKVDVNFYLDFASGAIYISYHLPVVSKPLHYCLGLIAEPTIQNQLNVIGGFSLQSAYPEEEIIHASSLKFCGRVYIYSENSLTEKDIEELRKISKQRGLVVHYRGPEWARKRSTLEKPLAFISYDSRDRDLIARPLAYKLSENKGCTVWFDEFSLKVGYSLRKNIEKGIKECKKCIVVLTQNYLTNDGWASVEFDSIFTRQILEAENIVLPVWQGVTKRDVYEFSPSLADNLGVNWKLGVEEVARQLHRALVS